MFSPPLPLWLHKITQQVLKRNLESNCGRNYVSGRRLKPPITNKSILSLNFAKKKTTTTTTTKTGQRFKLTKKSLVFPHKLLTAICLRETFGISLRA